jgi:AraC-like DNA-binding protein
MSSSSAPLTHLVKSIGTLSQPNPSNILHGSHSKNDPFRQKFARTAFQAATQRALSMALLPRSISDWRRLAKGAEFNPAKMASLCAISERHLQRLFKKQMGCSPARWLRRLQCHLAKELVLQGYSSKAAAAELKFATDAHFCREFKKVFGASPQQFALIRGNRHPQRPATRQRKSAHDGKDL